MSFDVQRSMWCVRDKSTLRDILILRLVTTAVQQQGVIFCSHTVIDDQDCLFKTAYSKKSVTSQGYGHNSALMFKGKTIKMERGLSKFNSIL